MPGRLQENVRLVVVQLVESLDRGKLRATELVGFFRVRQKAFERRFQLGSEVNKPLLAGNPRGRSDDQVRLIAQRPA